MSNAPDQTSVDQGAAVTSILSIQNCAPLLTIPIEIRHLVYKYFLKADKNTNIDHNDRPVYFDLKFLCLCRQLRIEALEYLAKNHMWIGVSVAADQLIRLQYAGVGLPTLSAPRLPFYLLAPQERMVFVEEMALNIKLGETSDLSKRVEEKKARPTLFFAYTTASYPMICQTMIKLRNLRRSAMSILVSQNFTDRNCIIIRDLILPFTIARGSRGAPDITIAGISNSNIARTLFLGINKVNRSGPNVQNHLSGLKEEGDKLFAQGHLVPAHAYYKHAVQAWQALHVFDFSASRIMSNPYYNTAKSILSDTIINAIHALNLLIDQSRDPQGVLLTSCYSFLDEIFTLQDPSEPTSLFSFLGMTPSQRQQAHLRHAKFLELMAEYLSNDASHHAFIQQYHDYVGSAPPLPFADLHYISATDQYFYAVHADPNSVDASSISMYWQSMCQRHNVYLNGGFPNVRTIRGIPGYPGGFWEGDPTVVGERTDGELRGLFARSVKRDDGMMTAEQLKGMMEDLGVAGEQVGGLFRLLS